MTEKRINLRKKPFYLTEEQETWVFDTLDAMTPEEKAGQLFVIMAKPGQDEDTKEAVETYHVGGVLYRPVHTKKELAEKFSGLDKLAKYPLLKVADAEEGNSGMAGGNGAAADGFRFSTQMAAAATGRMEDVTRLAYTCASEASEIGINWSYSPIADIDMNFRNPITNVRTFGSDPDRVAECAAEYIRVIQEAGIAACAKHFPGDGVDFRDQHLHPTCNTLSAEEWFRTYGKVYETLIGQGVKSIMAGHILQPSLQRMLHPAIRDEELLPASLCRELLSGILREKLGFNGVITTDSTTMSGYSMAMEREKAIPASVEAGCDMFCLSMNYKEDIGYLLKGLKNGSLSEKRLDEAVTRVLALKAGTALPEKKKLPEAPFAEWAAACADHAVTLVKDKKGILPIDRSRYPKISLVSLGEDEIAEGSLKEIIKKELEKQGFAVAIYDPSRDQLNGTGRLDRSTLTLYICNLGVKIGNTATHVYWTAERGMGIPRFPNELDYVFVSFGSPYHLADVPRIPAYINAYAASEIFAKAVAEKITGNSPFMGTSPVDAFCGLFDTRL